MLFGPWVLTHIDGDRYWIDWRDDEMSRTISQILDEVKARVEGRERDLFDAEARTEQVRETLRRVVAHARREHQNLKKWIEIKRLREFQLKACAAGPWHCEGRTDPDAPDSRLVAAAPELLAEIIRLREALQMIAGVEVYNLFPDSFEYEEDARYVWPARDDWYKRIATEALGKAEANESNNQPAP
jgi:hypothetical protein